MKEDGIMLNCDVKSFGAVGDGQALDTQAIQAAINECAAHGGGRVTLTDGQFLSGRIDMKSGVELHIERDAVLLGSKNALDFPEIETDFWRVEYAPRFNRRCFIYAEGCQDIAISGRGAIDCQGEAYMKKLPPEKAARSMWPFVRLGFPENFDDNASRGLHPDQRRVCSFSPARVVFFIGCQNVLVEDVTMRNQPAGWSYWICDCEDVHFHRAQIKASVLYPNNDGIHINCSRNVTVSDCNITCGDDGIVVRAYSLPLYKNTVCEKVAVTNCNITSHSGGIRIAWTNDGVIRNCTFSNLNMTDTNVGVDIILPGNPTGIRHSDEGEEPTHIENLNFSNITMDRVFHEPVSIKIDENCLCDCIRNLYFTGIHARAAHMPSIIGRPDCHVQNIYFTNCHFDQMRREEIPDEANGSHVPREYTLQPCFRHVDNLVMQDTVFNIF